MVRVQMVLRHIDKIDEWYLCLALLQDVSNEYTEITLTHHGRHNNSVLLYSIPLTKKLLFEVKPSNSRPCKLKPQKNWYILVGV